MKVILTVTPGIAGRAASDESTMRMVAIARALVGLVTGHADCVTEYVSMASLELALGVGVGPGLGVIVVVREDEVGVGFSVRDPVGGDAVVLLLLLVVVVVVVVVEGVGVKEDVEVEVDVEVAVLVVEEVVVMGATRLTVKRMESPGASKTVIYTPLWCTTPY